MELITDLKKYLANIEAGEKIYEVIEGINQNAKTGKYVISDKCYVNVVSYMPNRNDFEGVFECHKKYIDIQYLIKGSEKIFYGKRDEMITVKDYNDIEDCEWLKGNSFSFEDYSENQAVLLDVGEPHAGGYYSDSEEAIVKAVIKIKK